MSETGCARPALKASRGRSGRNSPSMTGLSAMVPGCRSGASNCIFVVAATMSSMLAVDRRRPASSDAVLSVLKSSATSLSSSTNSPAHCAVTSLGYTALAGELCAIALAKSPAAAGTVMRVVTALAPADSPKSVTFDASPPKMPILSRTHSRAATTSRSPRLHSRGRSGVEKLLTSRNPRAPRR